MAVGRQTLEQVAQHLPRRFGVLESVCVVDDERDGLGCTAPHGVGQSVDGDVAVRKTERRPQVSEQLGRVPVRLHDTEDDVDAQLFQPVLAHCLGEKRRLPEARPGLDDDEPLLEPLPEQRHQTTPEQRRRGQGHDLVPRRGRAADAQEIRHRHRT